MTESARPPMPVGRVIILAFDDGSVQAQTELDALQTMQAIGVAQAKLAVKFRQREDEKIQPAPPGLIVPRT